MSTTYEINPEKLAQLDDLTLHGGAHGDFEEGHCAMEVVAWLADLGHTDAPRCASPVLARLTIRLNDRWSHEKRQQLKPYLPLMVGTGGDGKDLLREQIATRFLAERLLEPWLRLAGLDDQVTRLKSLASSTDVDERRRVLSTIADAAYSARAAARARLTAKIKARWVETGKVPADAAAVAAAAADADAAAAADADAAVVSPGQSWSAAYTAARKYFAENPIPIREEIVELGASQDGLALVLLDLMIDPEAA